ncbi:hypothetical protein D3C77_307240 [compost metagenome]
MAASNWAWATYSLRRALASATSALRSSSSWFSTSRVVRRPTWASWRTPSAATEAARTACSPAWTLERAEALWA